MEEKELIKACIKQDRSACNQLFKKYAPTMLMVCMRYMSDEEEAKDVLQNGFIKVFNSLKSFRYNGSFEGWIKRIMINEALAALRHKKKYHVENSDVYERTDLAADISTEEVDDYPFTEEELLQVLGDLPENFKVVFNLYCLEKYSHKEIAKMLSIKTETSRSRLKRARRILKEKLIELSTQKEKISANG